jgi:hypothetical protein
LQDRDAASIMFPLFRRAADARRNPNRDDEAASKCFVHGHESREVLPMSYADDYIRPSELAGIRTELVTMRRALSDLQSTSARATSRSESRQPDLATVLIKALTAQFLAGKSIHGLARAADEVAERIFGRQPGGQAITEAARDLPRFLARATVSPATSTGVGYAAELVGSANYPGLLGALAPASVYAALAARGLRVAFNGVSTIKIPSKLSSPYVGGDFLGEGQPIPTRRLGLSPTTIGPLRKLASISHFTAELQNASVPTIEAVLRDSISSDTALLLDSKLLDNVASSTTRPAGLLNGVTPLTATAGGGLAALAGDLGALAAAIPNPADLVYIMPPADRVRALALSPGLLGVTIIEAAALTAKTVIALDCGDFVSGEGDTPRFDLSEQSTLHEDDAPAAIGVPGSPNVVSAPSRSLFQTDTIALRFIQFVVWLLARPQRIAAVVAVTW